MLDPDFSKYSLALIKDQKILFQSSDSRLMPLINCIKTIKEKNCTLHDKIVGLAAARLIVHSKIIRNVFAGTISKPALEFLKKNSIDVEYDAFVENILNQHKDDLCPMEKKALTEKEEFFDILK